MSKLIIEEHGLKMRGKLEDEEFYYGNIMNRLLKMLKADENIKSIIKLKTSKWKLKDKEIISKYDSRTHMFQVIIECRVLRDE
jgi:hypothetical protein